MIKRFLFAFIIVATLAAGCQSPTAAPTATRPVETLPVLPTTIPSSTPSPEPVLPTRTPTAIPPTATATLSYPVEGYGPTGFPPGIDPLTGLPVSNPDLLNRRPIVIKVENLPRTDRPQWGLSLADIVYEYYTEQGGTRFAAVYYGQDATKVGPIRSARWFDFNVVQMYKGVFAFGYAYSDLFAAILNSDFWNRVILEGVGSSPALTRYEPNGPNYMLGDTTAFAQVEKAKNIDNSKQNLDGMLFMMDAPSTGGVPASQIYLRYSAAIYNRWDYDPVSGRYFRFVDAADDPNRNNEKYVQLTDRLNNQPISADNLIMVYVTHTYVKKTPTEVFNMKLLGQGNAVVVRDGQLYRVHWKRAKTTDVMTFVNDDGSPFALKPGQTWMEVLGNNSSETDMKNGAWKYTWMIP